MSALRSAILLVFAIVFTLKATTYYVGKNGNDSYTPQQAQNPATPKLTINGAISSCVGRGPTDGAGHTIIVGSGTYDEAFDYDQGTSLPGGTSWNAPFTLKAAPGATVRLDPTGGACNGKACFNFTFYGRGYIIVDGIIVDGSHIAYDNIQLQCDQDHVTNCAHHIRFQNGELYNAYGSAVLGGGEYNEFINMKIHAAGLRDPNYGHNAMYLTGNHFLVENCEVYDGETGGIMFWDQYGHPSYNVARGNIVHDMREDGAGAGNAAGVGMFAGTENLAINNVVYNIQGPGIRIDYGCTGCAAYNNTSYGNTGQYGVGVGTSVYVSNSIVKNNICWNNENADFDNTSQTTTFGNNQCQDGGNCTVIADPKFVNAAGHDFHLLSSSPAINAGLNLSSEGVIIDKDGVTRPQGGAYDIGAYEYTGGTVITTSLAVSSTSVAPGAAITVTVTGGSNDPTEWVGLYLSSASDADWDNCENCWKYLNGTQTAPASAVTTPVTLTFVAPPDAGTYNFRLFPTGAADNRLAISSNFTVTSSAGIVATPVWANRHLSASQVGNRLMLKAYFPVAGRYSLSVYDLSGKLRWGSNQRFTASGEHTIDLAGMGKSMSNGLYLISLTTRTGEIRMRVALMK